MLRRASRNAPADATLPIEPFRPAAMRTARNARVVTWLPRALRDHGEVNAPSDHYPSPVVVGQEWAQRAMADDGPNGRLDTAFVVSSNPGA